MEQNPGKLLFAQRDKTIVFKIFKDGSGEGVQVGTTVGDITGTSVVNFRFKTTPGSDVINFHDYPGITDTNGDQIIFKNIGSGHFICTPCPPLPPPPFSCIPALVDPTATSDSPEGAFQVFGNGIGAFLTGTYEVVNASGKLRQRYPIGQILQYRASVYNPSVPPGDPLDLEIMLDGTANFKNSLLGTVYVEVYSG